VSLSLDTAQVEQVKALDPQSPLWGDRAAFASCAQVEQVKALDPQSFEDLVGIAFERLGYTVQRTPSTGDQGVDLFIRKNGGLGIVQCKRYDGSVGARILRELCGAMVHYGADEAYLVTTGRVTRPARKWCESKPIRLIDRTNLISWLESAEKPRTRQREEGARAGTVSSSTNTGKTSQFRERKLWYRSLGSTIVLVFLTPVWAFLILTHKGHKKATKIIAFIMLALYMASAIFVIAALANR
jgi:hypothetical protein